MYKELPYQLTLDECLTQSPQLKVPHKNSQIVQHKQCSLTRIKSHLPESQQQFYSADFVRLYIMIKLNSIAKPCCEISSTNCELLEQICNIYNENPLDDITVCNSEDQMISQIICKIGQKLKITEQQFQNLCQGTALLTSIAVWLLKQAKHYVSKEQIIFCLSFIALGGRSAAFTPIVHRQKNHYGQIHFAEKVFEMTRINQVENAQRKVPVTKVQDPYSMRCSPHVQGITYDLFKAIEEKLVEQINYPHHKYVIMNGKRMANLLKHSDSLSLKLDYLLCSLQQIGAISFLRSERILNSYLGKNKLQTQMPEQYESLKVMMNKGISLTAQNKVLSQMGNADTMNLHNYQSDVFFNTGTYYSKSQKMIKNLYYIMTLQALSAKQALQNIHANNVETLFIDPKVQKSLNFFCKNTDSKDRKKSQTQVRQMWQIPQ